MNEREPEREEQSSMLQERVTHTQVTIVVNNSRDTGQGQATLARAHPLALDLAEFTRWIQHQDPRRYLRATGPQGVLATFLLATRHEHWDVELSLAAPRFYPDAVSSLPEWARHLHAALGSMGYQGTMLVPAMQVAHLLRSVVARGERDDDDEDA
jgi:hypothetical protein